MKRVALLVAIAATVCTPVHAERSPAEGSKLAQEAVKQLKDLQDYVLEGNGLAGAGPSIYYKKFENPLQASLNKWPTVMQPEANTWDDYMYCRDALMALMAVGMSQNSGTFKTGGKRKIAEYQHLTGKCEAASKLTSDQL